MSSSNPYDSPQLTGVEAQTGVLPMDTQGDATGGIIPYKNPAALAAYYLGIVGLFPIVGLFASIPAFVLGIIGLRRRKANPAIKGSVHAWIGIVLGALATLGNLACITGIVVAGINEGF